MHAQAKWTVLDEVRGQKQSSGAGMARPWSTMAGYGNQEGWPAKAWYARIAVQARWVLEMLKT